MHILKQQVLLFAILLIMLDIIIINLKVNIDLNYLINIET